MFRTDAISKDWKEAGSFAAQVNLFGFWDERCFLTKTGDLGMAIRSVASTTKASTMRDGTMR